MKEAISLPIAIPQTLKKVIYITTVSLSFVIPFSLSHSQIVTGIIVNALLFLSVWYLDEKETWSVIVLPSLAVLSRGVIFGPFTPFLLYFIPFIWLGNYALIAATKYLSQKINIPSAVVLASIGKFVLLFLAAEIYFKFNLVPQLFLKSMGVFQLVTALSGGALALSVKYFLSNGKSKS